jgi:hypothetical protein
MTTHHDAETSRDPAPDLGENVVTMPDPAQTEHLAWLERRRLSEDTIRIRTRILQAIAAHTRAPLLQVTPGQLESWERSLTVSDASRAAYLTHVRAFYAWALVNGKIDRDPSVRLIPPKLPRRAPRPISEPDLAMALMTAPPRVAPWLELAAYAGFRAGEIARLTREDVHDELATPVLVAQGKGRKERVIPMAGRVWTAVWSPGSGQRPGCARGRPPTCPAAGRARPRKPAAVPNGAVGGSTTCGPTPIPLAGRSPFGSDPPVPLAPQPCGKSHSPVSTPEGTR